MHGEEQLIEEEQAHRVQVSSLLQMQLQAMERVEEQERELRRLSNLMAKHHLRGATERGVQVPDLGNLPMLRRNTLEDILAEQEEKVPLTLQTWVRFSTSTPVVRPVEQPRERTQSSRVSKVPSDEQGLFKNLEPKKIII